MRPFKAGLKDPDDVREAGKTRHILKTTIGDGFASVFRCLAVHPLSVTKALFSTLRFARASGGHHLRHLAYLWEAMVLADWCRKDGIEHLHVHFGTNPATVATLAHQICGIRFSFTVHGPEEFDRPESLGLCDKIKDASFVVAVSSYGRSQLLRWAELKDWKKVQVVHCGLDERYLLEEGSPCGEDPRLVCIARLSEQKGHLLLLQAAARLQQEGCRLKLVLVGDGPLRADVESEILRLGLGETVVLTGMIGQDDVRDEILHAKALVLPSFAEGLPVVLMESLALKRPVISTYIAGIPELVQPDNGWLVPAGDIDALCSAMRDALSASGSEIVQKGEAGRRRALERHDVNKSAAVLEGLMADAATI